MDRAKVVVYVVRSSSILGSLFWRASCFSGRVSARRRDAGGKPLEELGFEILQRVEGAPAAGQRVGGARFSEIPEM